MNEVHVQVYRCRVSEGYCVQHRVLRVLLLPGVHTQQVGGEVGFGVRPEVGVRILG